MKEKWKVISSVLSDEYDIEVQPSYEGWGAGYDPKSLPLTEMWMKGEIEDIPHVAKIPRGIVFAVTDFIKRTEDYTINAIRHEIELLLNSDFYLWRLGQREFFRFGYSPASFVVLYAVLESMKVDELLINNHPSSVYAIRQRYEEILDNLKDATYPHYQFVLDILRLWLGKDLTSNAEIQKKVLDLRNYIESYLSSKNKDAYEILMNDIFGKYRILLEKSQQLNYVDLLLDEAKGKTRQDGHKGRIMTDVLSKLPQKVQEFIKENTQSSATQMFDEDVSEILKSLKTLPEWMRDYVKQMSYIDLLERDLRFLSFFLPKTLEVDVEHKGFITFIVKGWEDVSSSSALSASGSTSKGSGESQGKYRYYLKSVLPYVESLKRKFQRLLPVEEEFFGGAYTYGKRLNTKKLSTEIPIKRGKIFKRREIPERKIMAFKLLMDISSSMKREEKIDNAVKSLILVSEVLYQLGMPFSIDVFNDKAYRLKEFTEDYSTAKGKLINLFNSLGGTTDIGKALMFSFEDLDNFSKSNRMKGALILFSDGEPTRGVKGFDLKSLIRELKGKLPIVGIGLGITKNYIEEYFEGTGIRVENVAKLPFAFSFILENYLRRLEMLE